MFGGQGCAQLPACAGIGGSVHARQPKACGPVTRLPADAPDPRLPDPVDHQERLSVSRGSAGYRWAREQFR